MPNDYSGHDPYREQQDFDPYGQAQRPKSRSNCLIFGVVGGVVLLLACCGGGYWIMQFGFDVVAGHVESQVRDDPAIREHIGEIKRLRLDFTATATEGKEDVMVFNVQGTRGKGVIVGEVDTRGGEPKLVSGTLRLPSGETFDLDAN